MSPLRRPREREFYSIGEACDMLGLKPHVLRYWETQFEELAPPKTLAGKRVYRKRDLELIALIKRLVHDDGYTIQGARRRVSELEADGRAGALATVALEHSFLEVLHGDLEELIDLLDPDAV